MGSPGAYRISAALVASWWVLALAAACNLVLPVGVVASDSGLDAAGCLEGCSETEGGRKDAGQAREGGVSGDGGDAFNFGHTVDANVANITAQFACLTGQGWSWCNPSPTGVTLDAVWGSGSTDVWAVGSGGAAEHWNGTAWSLVPTPTTLELFSVWGTGPEDVWAAASNAHGDGANVAESTILHWDGTTWSVSRSLPATELWSMWGSSATDVWAVGASDPGAGIIEHWDGTSWTTVSSPPITVLNGVAGTSASDVWAVGNTEVRPDASTAENDGTFIPEILHWDGTMWSIAFDNNGAAAPSLLPLAVWATSAVDAWAATSGDPLHWNGLQWLSVTVPGTTTGPTSFGGTGPDDLWGTLGSSLAHWNGSGWDPTRSVSGISSAGTEPLTFSSVWASSTTDVWAVGLGGALAHFDGTSWKTVNIMPELFSAWARSPTDAWAVGAGGIALHWNGTVWSSTSTGTAQSLTAVWGDSSDVWALGADATVIRWNGAGWAPFTAPTTDPIIAIGGTSSSDVWVSNGANDLPDGPSDAGGNGDGGGGGASNAGQVFHWNGGSWSSTVVPLGGGTASWINSVWANTTDDVWAVGYQAKPNLISTTTGIVVHWDGIQWTLFGTPLELGATIATGYTSVWGSRADDVWAAGTAVGATTAAVIHWNGTEWSDATLANLTGTDGLWGSGPNDVWLWAHFAGTLEESVMHWDGSVWASSLLLPDVWSYGNCITGTGPTDLWAVGSAGMILHHM